MQNYPIRVEAEDRNLLGFFLIMKMFGLSSWVKILHGRKNNDIDGLESLKYKVVAVLVSASSHGQGRRLDLEAAQLLVPNAGGEGLRFRRRVFVVAVNDDVDVNWLRRLLAHQRRHAELALHDLHLDQLLQREQVVVLECVNRPLKNNALGWIPKNSSSQTHYWEYFVN